MWSLFESSSLILCPETLVEEEEVEAEVEVVGVKADLVGVKATLAGVGVERVVGRAVAPAAEDLDLTLGNGRGSTTYSSGGGRTSTIPSGTFSGRSIGGGTRSQVYGSSRYGSGYTYGGGGSSVAGRGFPFGYWPVYIPVGGAAYYGYREYGPVHNASRPGGEMQQALVRSTSWPAIQSSNSTNSTTPAINNATASYYIVGDADTVSAVMEELVEACSVVSTQGVAVNETNPSIYFEQAVQFYRASSFMLVLTSYNNTANRIPINGTEPPTGIPDTPLPPENSASNSVPAHLPALGNLVGLVWIVLWLFKLL